ncbi:MAG: 3-deoxy-D-manno-octulosonic acid transferase, partial [Saprospiraceae bacterium]|nr:3-deoxy-D-manno-octulosonic acid transferase [Saprospiraceae bacterium]
MILLYDFALICYKTTLCVAAFFNPKAKKWCEGRRYLFAEMAEKLSKKGDKQTVWIHVASLGEFEQGRPLIEKIKKERPDGCLILTFFSPSGYEMRKNYPLADYVFYLPLDTRRNAHRFLDLVKPDLVIFVKYEFWFHFLHALKKRRIPTLLISGIFRKKPKRPPSVFMVVFYKKYCLFSPIFFCK